MVQVCLAPGVELPHFGEHHLAEQIFLREFAKQQTHLLPNVFWDAPACGEFNQPLAPRGHPRVHDFLGVGDHGLGEVDVQGVREAVEVAALLDAHERQGNALLACAGGSARTVGVVRRLARKRVVEDVCEVVHVDATRGHVGGHENLEVLLLEPQHDAVALGLRHLAVQGVGPVAALEQLFGQRLGVAAGAAEHHPVKLGVKVEEARNGLGFVRVTH